MKRRYQGLMIIGILVIFVISPYFQFVKGLVIMSIYSKQEAGYSLLNKEKIQIDMPGGLSTLKKDWFPLIMTFNDDYGFSNYSEQDVQLSILYNFGAFEYLKGASAYYNPKSQFFNAFYGAYAVKGSDFAFGYREDGTPDYEQMAEVPEYDMSVLVLESIGCEDPTFQFDMDATYKIDEFLGYKDWDVIEATLTTNSPVHKVVDSYQAYIQYGKPSKTYYTGKDFPEIQVKGKIYARYFKEKGCSIFLYVIAPNAAAILQCDQDFLQKTSITLK